MVKTGKLIDNHEIYIVGGEECIKTGRFFSDGEPEFWTVAGYKANNPTTLVLIIQFITMIAFWTAIIYFTIKC